MKTPPASIMIIDDNKDDNFFHEREIRKVLPNVNVILRNSGSEALKYLKSVKDKNELLPSLIFLDINMPLMNGWQFLKQFGQLEIVSNIIIIVMLSTVVNEQDARNAKTTGSFRDFVEKPLTKEKMETILSKYFQCGPETHH